MAATLLHYGRDLHDRVSVLRRAGYAVIECRSVIQLRSVLQTGDSADAVVLTEGLSSESGISVTRSKSDVPFILFEDQPSPNSDFDLVIPVRTPPAQWLSDVEALLAKSAAIRTRSREIMARSAQLTREANEVIERTQRELARSRQERSRDTTKISGDWGAVAFEEGTPATRPTCPKRNELDKSILFSLARLTQILHRMLKEHLESNSASESLAGLMIEHDHECATLESFLTQWKAHRNRHRC